VIAVDGPVASGKSAVGKLVAQRLSYQFVDTGQMYRAVTWLAIYLRINLRDEAELSKLAGESLISLSSITGRVSIQDYDISSEIYSFEVDAAVSQVSSVQGVRQALVERQRALSEEGKVVMVGRDIGTVVLPHADLKVFLTASVEVRAQRRYLEKAEKGKANYNLIIANLRGRDDIDTHRAVSPLCPAPDAHVVDTGELTLEQVVSEIIMLMGQSQ